MSDDKNIILEACVETLDEAIYADRMGASRLELCASLEHDGLTPSARLTASVIEAVHIPVKVMIRCRKGNFEYSESELQLMQRQMYVLSKLNIAGFAFGALNHNALDIDAIIRMTQIAPGIPITIHKAIDATTDIIGEARKLRDIPGVSSVLTSGGRDTASNGIETINALYDTLNPEITVIAAGKVTHSNLSRLKETLKVQEYHGRRIVGTLNR